MIEILTIFVFILCGIPMIISELENRTIPDYSTILSITLIVVIRLFLQRDLLVNIILNTVIGAVLGFIVFYLFSRFFTVGFGDVKYAAAIGALTGWKFLFPAFGIASFTAIAIMGTLMLIKKLPRDYAIPFGPFLMFGGIAGYVLRSWWGVSGL